MIHPKDVVAVLAGAWYLVNQTQHHSDGSLFLSGTKALGERPVGLLQYTSNGYMAANIQATEPGFRPQSVSYPPKVNETNLDNEWALVGKHILAYAGPYSVTPETNTTGQIIHGPLTFAHIPSWVGVEQKRNYSLEAGGDLLRVRARSANGDIGDLFWRRMPSKFLTNNIYR